MPPETIGWRWPLRLPRSAPRAPSIIHGADSVAISYPEFFSTLESLCD